MKTRLALATLVAAGWLALGPACGKTPDPGADASVAPGLDAAQGKSDAGRADTGPYDAGPADEHGFHIRVPQVRTVPCNGPMCQGSTSDLRDQDFVCTLKHGALDGFVYSQSNAIRNDGMAGGFIYESAGAWVSVGGTATEVTAEYDRGGNHQTDSLTFTYQGQKYRTYHSTFGPGWRACRPMDCLDLLSADGHTVLEEGCSPARTLPIVCVAVADDGTVPPLVDTYEKCAGDPNLTDAGK